MNVISNVVCIIAVLYGGYLIISGLIKLYCIVFLKRPYKEIGTSFNYCRKSMLFYIGYAITGICLGTIFFMYGYFRQIYDGPILNVKALLLYMVLLSFWSIFKSNEERIKAKYHIEKQVIE